MTFDWQVEPRLPNPRWFIAAVLAACLIVGFIGLAHAEPVYLIASWYSRESLIKEGTWKNGKENKMANGETFNEKDLTCATQLYPLGSVLRVTNSSNRRWVIVTTTDRIGKRFAKTRIDLSKAAFQKISRLEYGLTKVSVERIK